MSRTARIQERGFETRLKELGLTRVTWCILLAVETEALRFPSAIAEFVGVDRTATSRALRKMSREGLIQRNDEESDGRRTAVVVTVHGRDVLECATHAARENAAHFEAKLSATERETLRKLIHKLQSGDGTPLAQL
ncbi:MarR family winged helix-turn-helix transcriptional regulator [Falsihalocynthiibacter sp. SS001]|uniref:MarR family winged helix-turn-helix transcriptional regulator n=1 Tax=Falsihalocynthiibacter sp. SS001 TaxID=3349698 RepID=UPI0036D429CE